MARTRNRERRRIEEETEKKEIHTQELVFMSTFILMVLLLLSLYLSISTVAIVLFHARSGTADTERVTFPVWKSHSDITLRLLLYTRRASFFGLCSRLPLWFFLLYVHGLPQHFPVYRRR